MTLYHYDAGGNFVLHAMPVMVVALLLLALAYRYYSAFLAAKVAVLDASRVTPANRFHDGQNYHPTNKWVLFGHHFAAISGAGPLIGPVLALQYGYMPGLIWLIVGVVLAGAVQDMLVMAASVRRDGKSLAEIARAELGRTASVIASLAILFIVIIALAGLGFVVVKALGGEEVKIAKETMIALPTGITSAKETVVGEKHFYDFPANCDVYYIKAAGSKRSETFRLECPTIAKYSRHTFVLDVNPPIVVEKEYLFHVPEGTIQVVPGSSWGTFTIASTIPIALLVGFCITKLKRSVLEASLLGGALVLFATVAGGWIPGSSWEPYFSLSRDQTILALVIYGFIAAVLPVWLLLGPRDYLSSFLKIGTVMLLISSVIVANPPLVAPKFTDVFGATGPTFKGDVFPFVFICVMCGAVSGFHALVASGTTPKMIENEKHIRPIGYGAMLCECIVGITALIAAATLPIELYYDINIPIDQAPNYVQQLQTLNTQYGQYHQKELAVDGVQHLNLGHVEEKVGGESLRGRTGGAVTLAVGMSVIFENAFRKLGVTADWLLKYWYHFAIMFEALFILTTIDAGTRIGRFLLQETLGRVSAPFARPDWLPGAMLASAVITGGWGYLIWGGSIETIWPMFGIANQALAALALTLVTTWLVNNGRAKYCWVTLLPLAWVLTTTTTAARILVLERFPLMIQSGKQVAGTLNIVLTVFVMVSVGTLVLMGAVQWVKVIFLKK